MYSSKFVMCVLLDGTPQKELANGEIHLPFGSTYTIRLRNRNSRPAAAKIYIDGENVSGEGWRIPANDKVDIRRHADRDVSFKFVDLDSAEAIEFGKNGPNHDKVKGVIEARFYLEKDKPAPIRVEHHYHTMPYTIQKDDIFDYDVDNGIEYRYRSMPLSHYPFYSAGQVGSMTQGVSKAYTSDPRSSLPRG